jgi:hypothetical protein
MSPAQATADLQTLQARIAEIKGLPETIRSEVILALREARDDTAALEKAAAALEGAGGGGEAAVLARQIRELAQAG